MLLHVEALWHSLLLLVQHLLLGLAEVSLHSSTGSDHSLMSYRQYTNQAVNQTSNQINNVENYFLEKVKPQMQILPNHVPYKTAWRKERHNK
jgi:hypothetical protein